MKGLSTYMLTQCFLLEILSLQGGAPCLSIADSFLRFMPGMLGNEMSAADDSFENGSFDSPKWTRPSIFKGQSVPEVLLTGNHAKVEQFNNQ